MLKYLPALGEHEPLAGYGTGLEGAALGVTSGLRTSWDDVLKIMRGKKDGIFNCTWFKDIVFRPAEDSLCLFDSGLYSVFGLAKKDPSMDLKKFFENYAPAYKDYINFVLKSIPESSVKHCFFVNLDTDFLLGLEKTREFNDFLLSKCPEGKIVGTYHAADGKAYLDELIEKFDYIAVADALKFVDDQVSLDYVQGICEYARNRKPDIKIHVLGRSDADLFRKVGCLASTCDSSSYRFFGEPGKLIGTEVKLSDFWRAGLDYGFCGGMEKAKSLSASGGMTDMQYSAMIVETLTLYLMICLINRYSPQTVRENCPVRDVLDGFFGIPHGWWKSDGGKSARYLKVTETSKFEKGKVLKKKEFAFLTEFEEGCIDLGATSSEFENKRKNDWKREAPRPEKF